MSSVYFEVCSLAQLPASLRLFLHGQWALATAPVSLHGAYFSLVSFAAGRGCRAMKRKEKKSVVMSMYPVGPFNHQT
jgi:hypothetical protein